MKHWIIALSEMQIGVECGVQWIGDRSGTWCSLEWGVLENGVKL